MAPTLKKSTDRCEHGVYVISIPQKLIWMAQKIEPV
jgi:hypothetical protein